MRFWPPLVAAALMVILAPQFSSPAHAQSRTAQVPVQLGIGPAGHLLGGPTFDDIGWGGGLFEDQPIHTGLRLGITAVIDADLVSQHPGMVPQQYRAQIQQAGEVRYRPGVLAVIPRTLYLSHGLGDASAWGATWGLLGVGVALPIGTVRLGAQATALATAMYIRSPSARSPFIFVRPGAEINIDVEVPITDDFLISFGWASMLHIPQALDGGILDAGDFEFDENSLWHIGQFYVQGNYRIPYSHTYR